MISSAFNVDGTWYEMPRALLITIVSIIKDDRNAAIVEYILANHTVFSFNLNHKIVLINAAG